MSEHLNAGDRVEKVGGYKFVGIVLCRFHKLDRSVRFAVENGDGIIHIFNGSQLKRHDGRKS